MPCIRCAITYLCKGLSEAGYVVESALHGADGLELATTTLYMYVNGDGTVKEPGQKLLDALGSSE